MITPSDLRREFNIPPPADPRSYTEAFGVWVANKRALVLWLLETEPSADFDARHYKHPNLLRLVWLLSHKAVPFACLPLLCALFLVLAVGHEKTSATSDAQTPAKLPISDGTNISSNAAIAATATEAQSLGHHGSSVEIRVTNGTVISTTGQTITLPVTTSGGSGPVTSVGITPNPLSTANGGGGAVLHSNGSSGAPTFGAVNLMTDVTGH